MSTTTALQDIDINAIQQQEINDKLRVRSSIVILGITIKHDDVLSDVLASFREKYSSDKKAWEAACHTYRPIRTTDNDGSNNDNGSDDGDLNDDTTDESLYCLQIKSLEDALSKAIFMMENTKKDLASEKKDKGPVSEEEEEDLTRAISPDIVDTLTTVCLVAVLGIDTFSSMMKVLGTTVGRPFPTWLLEFKRLKRNAKRANLDEKKRQERMKTDEEYAKKRQRLDEMPTKQCSLCLKNKRIHSFLTGEWDKEGDSQCRVCTSKAAAKETDLAPELVSKKKVVKKKVVKKKVKRDENISRDPNHHGIKEPGPNDVMIGRGGATNTHPGNTKFRRIIEDSKSAYKATTIRTEKSTIASNIITEWRALDPPGRFLERNGETGLWNDIGDGEAHKKCTAKLREKDTVRESKKRKAAEVETVQPTTKRETIFV